MRRLARIGLIVFALVGCSSSAKTPADAASDGMGGGTGNPATCPTKEPQDGDVCTGTVRCGYGKATCCGVTSTARTCTCQQGHFSCAMTVECNFVCPDASSGGGD
jgi:hypothetical protein